MGLDLRFPRVLRIFKLTPYSAAMPTMLEVLRDEISVPCAAVFPDVYPAGAEAPKK